MKKKELLSLLEKEDIFPKKAFGQNFLWNESILDRIASQLAGSRLVIEIGTGPGTLTEKLAENSEKVITYDIDERLYMFSKKRLSEFDNIEFIHKDFLESDIFSYIDKDVTFVGNLPYNIASRIIVKLASFGKKMLFMLQKEVADRLISKKNSKNYSFFTAYVGFYCKPKRLFDISPDNFFPKPNVYSSIISLEPKKHDDLPDGFNSFVSNAFSCRRKKMVNNFSGDKRKALEKALVKLGYSLNVRAQELSSEEFGKLFSVLSDFISFGV